MVHGTAQNSSDIYILYSEKTLSFCCTAPRKINHKENNSSLPAHLTSGKSTLSLGRNATIVIQRGARETLLCKLNQLSVVNGYTSDHNKISE